MVEIRFRLLTKSPPFSATFHAALSNSSNQTNEGTITPGSEGDRILKMSRGVSIVLLFMYVRDSLERFVPGLRQRYADGYRPFGDVIVMAVI